MTNTNIMQKFGRTILGSFAMLAFVMLFSGSFVHTAYAQDDGGYSYDDGGTSFNDGGTSYSNDGGYSYNDGGTSYASDGGYSYSSYDGGTSYNAASDGGTSFDAFTSPTLSFGGTSYTNDGGVSYNSASDGGISYNQVADGGISYNTPADGGISYNNGYYGAGYYGSSYYPYSYAGYGYSYPYYSYSYPYTYSYAYPSNGGSVTTNTCVGTNNCNVVNNPGPVVTTSPSVTYTSSYGSSYVAPVIYSGVPIITSNSTSPYVSLTQIPYTGLDLGFWGTIAYWGFLILWCLFAAYLIAVKKVQNKVVAFLFGEKEMHVAHAVIAPAQQPEHAEAKPASSREAGSRGFAQAHATSHVAQAHTTIDEIDSFIFSQIHGRARA